jgi:hypothetical protein
MSVMHMPELSTTEVLRARVRAFVQHTGFDYFMATMVMVFTLVVFAQAIVDDPDIRRDIVGEENYLLVRGVLAVVDFFTLFFFSCEIWMKVFVYGFGGYFHNWLYVADAISVFLAILFGILELTLDNRAVTKLAKLRAVARLVRLILMFQQVEESAVKNRSLDDALRSPSERVLNMLNELKNMEGLTYKLRKDIGKAISTVASNKLYEPVSMDSPDGESKTAEDKEAANWLIQTTNAGGRRQGLQDRGGGGRGFGSTMLTELSKFQIQQDDRRSSGSADEPDGSESDDQANDAENGVNGENHDENHRQRGSKGKEENIAPKAVWTDEATDMLSNYRSYDFDVFALQTATKGNALRSLALHVVDTLELLKEINVDRTVFDNFIYVVEQTYIMPDLIKKREKSNPLKPGLDDENSALIGSGDGLRGVDYMMNSSRSSNPYHNATHGADVLQTALFMIYGGGLLTRAALTPTDVFTLIFAGAIHDFGHPGQNNMYFVKTQHPLATRYNDKAVLEMHHVAAAYTLIHSMPAFGIFNGMELSVYSQIRELALACVLATDMSSHFAELGRFKSRIQAGDFLARQESTDLPTNDDKLLGCSVMLHACDISNPAKNLDSYLSWTTRVLFEFFAQGDAEKEAGVAVSMFMDRDTTNIAKCQLGFIDILVYPLFDALASIADGKLQCCLDNLDSNKDYWKGRVDEMEKELVSKKQRMPVPDKPESFLELVCENGDFFTRVSKRLD